VEFWWNNSTGVVQQSFNVLSHDRQIPGDGLQTDTDLKSRSQRLDGSRCRLNAPSSVLGPAVDVYSTAGAAGIDHDGILVFRGRLATAAWLHRTEVQRASRSDDNSLRYCSMIEDQEQLQQQRGTQNDSKCWF